MKKKVIAIVCAVAVLAAAGGGVTWHFLGNGTKEDDNVVYVNTVNPRFSISFPPFRTLRPQKSDKGRGECGNFAKNFSYVGDSLWAPGGESLLQRHS